MVATNELDWRQYLVFNREQWGVINGKLFSWLQSSSGNMDEVRVALPELPNCTSPLHMMEFATFERARYWRNGEKMAAWRLRDWPLGAEPEETIKALVALYEQKQIDAGEQAC